MKGGHARIVLSVLALLFVIPFVFAEEQNCKNALLTGDFAGASDCYSAEGDVKMRDATNALVVGNYSNAISLAKEATRLKSGFGLCFQFDSCGGAAHTSAIMAVAAEKQGSDAVSEKYAKQAVMYAKGSGQCGGSTGEGNDLCAALYIMSTMSKLRDASTYQSDQSCKLIAGTGDIRNLDILYMGSNFTTQAPFEAYVANSTATLLGFAPFKDVKQKINVWRLEENTNFDCQILEPRMFQCDAAKIVQKRVACPNDQVIIVVKSSEWRGFGFVGSDLSGTSSWSDMPYSVVLHEFGHAFGNLADEYVYPDNNFDADLPNCDGAATCTKFGGVGGCFAGCQSSARYRSMENGMMRELGQPFGPLDEKLLKERIARYGS